MSARKASRTTPHQPRPRARSVHVDGQPIYARGRIYGELAGPRVATAHALGVDLNGQPLRGTNLFGKIDGARFLHYDPETRSIVVRVDHSEIPEFWLELNFTLDEVNKFVRLSDQDAGACDGDSESDEMSD